MPASRIAKKEAYRLSLELVLGGKLRQYIQYGVISADKSGRFLLIFCNNIIEDSTTEKTGAGNQNYRKNSM